MRSRRLGLFVLLGVLAGAGWAVHRPVVRAADLLAKVAEAKII
jgi:hypothetical protein